MPAIASFLFRKEAYRAAFDLDLEADDFDFVEVIILNEGFLEIGRQIQELHILVLGHIDPMVVFLLDQSPETDHDVDGV